MKIGFAYNIRDIGFVTSIMKIISHRSLLINPAIAITFLSLQLAISSDATRVNKFTEVNPITGNIFTLGDSLEAFQHRLKRSAGDEESDGFYLVFADLLADFGDTVINATQKQREEDKSRLMEDFYERMGRTNLDSAASKFVQFNDEDIASVVHNYYRGINSNFQALARLITEVTNFNKRYLLGVALYEETKNKTDNLENLLKLSAQWKVRLINEVDVPSDIKKKAVQVFQQLREDSKEVVVQKLTESFLNRTSSLEIYEEIFSTTYHYNFLHQAANETIDRVLKKLSIPSILNHMDKYDYYYSINEKVALFEAIFNVMQSTGELQSDLDSTLTLASLLKKLTDKYNYYRTEANVKSKVDRINKNMPSLVRTLVLLSRTCIRNVLYNEYLYAASSSDHWYDDDRRNVFTWIGGGKNHFDHVDESEKFEWTLQRNGNKFEIVNKQFNEHLFAGDAKWDDERRYAFTWRPGGTLKQSRWMLEPDGNYFRIKNVNQKEYLFADNDKIRDSTRRNVFTYVGGNKTAQSQWELTDC